MSNQIVCDGCPAVIGPHDAHVRGEVEPGYSPVGIPGLPTGEVHLCESCATYAFTALRDRSAVAS